MFWAERYGCAFEDGRPCSDRTCSPMNPTTRIVRARPHCHLMFMKIKLARRHFTPTRQRILKDEENDREPTYFILGNSTLRLRQSSMFTPEHPLAHSG